MSDDLLGRATRALRDETAAPADTEHEATLARLERSLARPRTVRGSRWLVMPIAAVFLAMAALASASGRLPRWLSIGPHPDSERTVRLEAPPPRPTVFASPPRALPSAPPPVVVASAPSAVPAPSAPRPVLVDVDALYRKAHEAHFVEKNPAAALAAWDRYLAAAGPSGRFSLEARYNRALSLVRLGRKGEAAAALRPFAEGEYGGYRRDEARELLRSLE